MDELLTTCRWPALTSPYGEALRQAVHCILQRVPDTIGIIVSGTIVRGTPSASSDLDIYVIRQKAIRQRLQYFFNGVPAEIFINPPAKVKAYITEERRAGRPITAHMLATGFIVLERDAIVAALRAEATEALSRPFVVPPQQLTSSRYMAAARFEDATDMVETDRDAARMILNLVVCDMLRYHFLRENQAIPRDKDLLKTLQSQAAPLAELARRFLNAASLDEALALAHSIADHTIETYGFFEWESEPETVEIEPPA